MPSLIRKIARLTIVALMVQLFTVVSALWVWPVEHRTSISRAFDLSNGPYGSGHRGIDISLTTGTAIRSPVNGVVNFVGVVAHKPVVTIRVSASTLISFEPVETTLSVGDRVSAAQEIGRLAAGGHCEAECLHVGVRVNEQYVNPMKYFTEKPVLLPW